MVVLGATGITGRCVVRRLIERNRDSASRPTPIRWAAAGRNEARLRDVLRDEGVPDAGLLRVDLGDDASIRDAASRTRVLLNLAGPFTGTAERVIEQCVQAGTSYVDVSGELPLLRRVNRRFDDAARAAGVQIVQMAGWEAMPADVTTLVACREAAGTSATTPEQDGPGAGGVIRSVEVSARFTRTPDGPKTLSRAVSGGTLASIVAQLRDDESRLIGDAAGLLPESGAADAVRSRSPLTVRPHVHRGRLLGPVVPVAFLNPPIVHRTAALLAREGDQTHVPARYREGTDSGAVRGCRTLPRLSGVARKAAVQRALISVGRMPSWLRRGLAALLGRVVPQSGTGPSGADLTDWEWTVRADAMSNTGTVGSSTLTGTGHPGYTATATIITAVGSYIADTANAGLRSGCLTPALALGIDGIRSLTTPQLRFEE